MIPVIAIVGRPNVGKSTLFNRLTRSRDALVADVAGLTRDRKYGHGRLVDYPHIVIDTGGLSGEEEGISLHMASQTRQAIREADIILFVVDGRAGMMPADYDIAQYLRQQAKTVILVVNKTDGVNPDIAVADFYQFGFSDVIPIAASHGRGVTSLISYVLEPYIEQAAKKAAEEAAEHERQMAAQENTNTAENNLESNNELRIEEINNEDDVNDHLHDTDDGDNNAKPRANGPVKIAVVGRPNVGKSTLVNRILGEERVVVFDAPGTTRDSILIDFERHGKKYSLFDTAGVRRRSRVNEAVEKFSIIKTLQSIEEANVVILMIDAREGLTDQDLTLLGFIVQAGKGLIIAMNKWDGLSADVKQHIKHELHRRLQFADFALWHFISALHGTGVGELFQSINRTYESAMKNLPTSALTRILQQAVTDHQPPLVRGRRIKLRYAHAGGHNPPVIVIHGNQTDELSGSYKRYLVNVYREALDLVGTPVRLQFKSSQNPFDPSDKRPSVLATRKERERKKQRRD